MNYNYTSIEKTTVTRDGYSTTTTKTTRTTGGGDTSSVVVHELTESEVSQLTLSDSPSAYEISDDDRLTKYDFFSLMNTEDELESDTESESDIEYHWFPSLTRNSVIQFLDDQEQEKYMEDDLSKVEIIEQDDEEDQEEEEETMHIKKGGKRHYKRQGKPRSKKPKRSQQVPVEVLYIVI